MRLVFVSLLAIGCGGSGTKPTHPQSTPPDAANGDTTKAVVKTPFSLEVLEVEARSEVAQPFAEQLSSSLRAAAREYDAIKLGPGSHNLVDQKVLVACDDEAPTCMAKVAHNVHADRIVYGSLEPSGPKLDIVLKLLVAKTKYVIEWTGRVSPDDASLKATARDAMASLLSRAP